MFKKIVHARALLLLFGVFLMSLLLSFVAFQGRTAEAAAGTNETINYQARLLTQSGAVVADGTYNIEFKIYCGGDGVIGTVVNNDCTNSTNEDLLWTETREGVNKVTVKNGFFSVYLGSVNAFSSNVNWNEDKLWLTVNIGSTGTPAYDGEMSPFTRFSSTPYALNSKLLGGLASTSFLQLAQGMQTDSSTANTSISVNKTGTTASIIDLQRSSSSVFKIANDGSTIFKNQQNSTSAFTIQNSNSDALFTVDTQSNSGAGIITLSPQSILLGGSTNLIQRSASGTTTIDLVNASTTTLAITNSGAGAANVTADGTISGRTLSSSYTGQSNIFAFGNTDGIGNDAGYTGFGIWTGSPATEKWFIGRNGTGNTEDLIFRQGGATDVATLTTSGALQLVGNIDTASTIQAGSSNITLTLASGMIDADALTLTSSGTAGSTFSNSGLEVVGDGLTLLKGCSDGQVLKWDDVTDIRWECAADATGGGGSTLQGVYDTGNTIDTPTSGTAKDIGFTLSDSSGTDSNFTITTATGSTAQTKFTRADGAGSTGPNELVLIDNLDVNLALANGLTIQSAAGKITTGLNVSDAELDFALSIGANDINSNGITISSAELNLLDGHSLALVDTGYTGTLGITGTGALAAGSITSGFGAIDTGTDSISTTGSVNAGSVIATGSVRAGGASKGMMIGDAGFVGAGFDCYAAAHSDRLSLTNYALAQCSNGATNINASTGQQITFANNNMGVGSFSSTGLNIAITGKTALTINDSGAQSSGLTIGSDTNLYRGGADILQTDSAFNIFDNGNTSRGLTIKNTDVGATAEAAVKVDNGTHYSYFAQTNDNYWLPTLADAAMFYTNADNGYIFVNNGAAAIMQLTQNGQLQLAAQSSAGGLLLGGDASLYRSAGDTLTGEIFNATTGINTGTANSNAGTQRIDASGNLVNIGNITGAGIFSYTANSASLSSINLTGTGEFEFLDSGSWFMSLSDTGAYNYQLDATDNPNYTVTNNGSGNVITNLVGTGDFIIQDNSSAVFTVNDSGNIIATGSFDTASTIQAGSSNITLTLASGMIDADALTLTSSGTTGSTFSSSGLEVASDGLTLLKGCSDGQVLKWDDVTDIRWECAADATGGGGSDLDGVYDADADKILTIDSTTGLFFDMTTTGDFVVRDGTTPVFTVADDGSIVLAPNGASDIALTLDDDSQLIGTGTITNSGQLADINLTLGADADVDTISAFQIDVTSANTGDADLLYGLNIGNLSSADSTVSETGLRVGSGWDTAIEANGNIVIESQADATSHNFASGCNCSLNSAAGTFGAATGRDSITSSVVYKGKLFVSTKETDGAAVYRYDGGTTWTMVTNAVGKAVAADTVSIDSYSLTVYNGILYIGSQGTTNTAGIYSSSTAHTTADSFVLVNSARGTFGMSQAAVDGVQDMVVWNGNMYISTTEPNLAEIGRYGGGSTFIQITPTDGKSVAETTADKDGFILAAYQGMLVSGSITGSTQATVAAYQGNGTTWTNLNGATTAGVLGAETAYIDITGMMVWNGSLYVAASKANAAAVYVYNGTAPVANVATNFRRVTTTVGKLATADAANIDSIILRNYNGRLYAGSQTATAEDTAALYEYPGVAGDWTLINTTRGTFGGQTGVNSIASMISMDGVLYLGTDDPNLGSVYTWTKTSQNSFSLRFDSGNSNFGGISFVGDRQLSDNAGHNGSFVFTNPLATSSGAFDYAEDYPSLDSSLEPGEPVSVDPSHPEHVKRAESGEPVLGVVSERPGFRLSSDAKLENGAEWVPIAMVGRVPVKVTTQNGTTPIKAGDSLAMSQIPGVLEKAGPSSGAVVGTALESYSDSNTGKISLYVNPQINTPSVAITSPEVLRGLDVSAKSVTLEPSSNGDATAFTVKNQFGDNKVAIDNQGNAQFAGTITADKIKANQIEGLEILTDKISSLSDKVAASTSDKTSSNVESISNDSTATSAVEFSNLKVQTAEVVLNLNVNGTITSNGGLVVGGPAQFKAETTFQKLATFIDRVVFKQAVIFENHATFGKDAGGIAIIKPGANKVEVKFQTPYEQNPIVNANFELEDSKLPDGTIDSVETKQTRLLEGEYSYAIGRVTERGFTIILNKPATEDIQFHWVATSVQDATISQSR